MQTPPERTRPSDDWEHIALYNRVRNAIQALPTHFSTETNITGLPATDIFTLGAVLGATIEEQVVETLNMMRDVWDPQNAYPQFAFVRQSQAFPDILFSNGKRRIDEGCEIIMGIDLKGWYLLAKEGEPSFRYRVSPQSCAVEDLLVVVPWALSEVIAGTPQVYRPYVEAAKYAARFRNYHWQHLRNTTSDVTIETPTDAEPYPAPRVDSQDHPVYDGGNNFGRFARTGAMDDYVDDVGTTRLRGIPARYWRDFFCAFQYEERPAETREQVEKIIAEIQDDAAEDADKLDADRFAGIIMELIQLFRE